MEGEDVNPLGNITIEDHPKHYYSTSFCYLGGPEIFLVPSTKEPHRWFPYNNEAAAAIPHQPETYCRILLYADQKVVAEHNQSVPLTAQWLVENIESQKDFVSTIVWNGGRFESCTVKMEYHLQLYKK